MAVDMYSMLHFFLVSFLYLYGYSVGCWEVDSQLLAWKGKERFHMDYFQAFTCSYKKILQYMRHVNSYGNTDHGLAKVTTGRGVEMGRDWPEKGHFGHLGEHRNP